MKIDDTILSLPPLISTTWEKIQGIFAKDSRSLEIHLCTGAIVSVPMPEPKVVERIFHFHLQSLEKKGSKSGAKTPSMAEGDLLFHPLKNPMGLLPESFMGLSQIMQHDPQQADLPLIPKDFLDKVIGLAKSLNPDTPLLFHDAQPHCHCIYCQIGKAIDATQEHQENDEPVSDKDLKFKEWEITQKGTCLYELKNPLDSNEIYQVYLGNPLGCTCGSSQCEHIKAVLNSEI